MSMQSSSTASRLEEFESHLGESFGQLVQLTAGAIDFAPRVFQLLAVHLPSRAGQAPVGTVDGGMGSWFGRPVRPRRRPPTSSAVIVSGQGGEKVFTQRRGRSYLPSASLLRAAHSRRARACGSCGERVFLLAANLYPPSSYYSRIPIPRSSPKSTFFGFDRPPISLRSGDGNRFISMGTATICSSLASFGCW